MDAACSDLKNNNSVTVYGENGSSSFQANVGPNGLYNMQPVGQPSSKFKTNNNNNRYQGPVSTYSQQYPQGKKHAITWLITICLVFVYTIIDQKILDI